MQGAQGDMRGHNSVAYGEEPQTALDALFAGFADCGGVLTEDGYLTDAPFGDGEVNDSWDEAYDYAYELYFEMQDKAAKELAMVEEMAAEAFERRDHAKPYVKGIVPTLLRWEVFKRDRYRCIDCGAWADLTVDHIVPEVYGGPTIIENLQTLCRSCNSKKGAR